MSKRVLISGATRGLGIHYAKALADEGYSVGLIDLSEECCSAFGEFSNIHDVKKFIWPEGNGVIEFADLTWPNQTERAVSSIAEQLGGIDILVANAGGDIPGIDPTASEAKPDSNGPNLATEVFREIFDRNFYTAKNLVDSALRFMPSGGKIILVSSILTRMAKNSEVAYSTAKASVEHWGRCLASSLLDKDVSVNTLILGPTQSARFLSGLKTRMPHDLIGLGGTSCLGRVGLPVDISPVLKFLVSNDSNFLTGATIVCDGGITLK